MAKVSGPTVSQAQGGLQPSENTIQLLGRAFFERDTLLVARELLGCELWCQRPDEQGKYTRFVVVETEAYTENDAACHAARYTAETARGRSAILFGPPGLAYVYFVYGMHHCLNVVTEREGVAGAVLIRALAPVDYQQAKPSKTLPWQTHGPGRLTRALGITREKHNGLDVTDPAGPLILLPGTPVAQSAIVQTTRIGIQKAADYPWRFYLADSPWVSVR